MHFWRDGTSAETLAAEMERLGIEAFVAMGTGRRGGDDRGFRPGVPDEPGSVPASRFFHCVGVAGDSGEGDEAALAEFERRVRDPRCVGIKIYLGYQPHYAYDRCYRPFYELARRYDLPVVFHTGDTAGGHGLVKYAHPLTIDETAAAFPDVRFVMAHCGNPWIVDAVEVAAKNGNVFIDLSGLAVGGFDPAWFLDHYRGYVEHLKTWMTYLSDYGKFLYGTDWPLTDMGAYLEMMRRIVPEEHHDAVFHDNARRVFSRLERAPRLFDDDAEIPDVG